MKRILLTVLTFLAMQSAMAQAPDSFKYQAVVRNTSSALIVNQAVGVKVDILQGSSSGTTVYSETFTPTTNGYGLINLNIGNGTVQSGTFSAIDWSAGPYFIQVSIDITGGTTYDVMGTSQLLSVPFALHAKTVENDSDGQTLTFNNSTGDLTITGGNTVTLPSTSGGDNWGAQTVQTNSTLSGDGTTTTPLSVNGDLTDDQTLSVFGTDLTISGGNTVNLSGLQDGVDDADADAKIN